MVLSSEKITVNNLPKEFKDMAIEDKNELKTSWYSVYIEIFKEYYQKREAEKLKKSAEIMANIYEEDEELKSWIDFEENILWIYFKVKFGKLILIPLLEMRWVKKEFVLLLIVIVLVF